MSKKQNNKSQLKIDDCVVISVHRVPNINPEKSLAPGIVIATFESEAKRDQVLKSKSKLFETIYKHVYLEKDQSKEERLAAGNMRTLVNAINNRTRVSMRGNRVVRGNGQGARGNGGAQGGARGSGGAHGGSPLESIQSGRAPVKRPW